MTITGSEEWFVAGVAVIIAFLFGQTGVLNRMVDFIFKSKEARRLSYQDEIKIRENKILAQETKIEEMNAGIEALKRQISELDRDLIKTSTYVKTLLAYLETLMPEGSNAFVQEMAKEIRNENRGKRS